MVKDQKTILKDYVHDTNFLSSTVSSEFFKVFLFSFTYFNIKRNFQRKNRSRAYDSPDVRIVSHFN